MKDKMLRALYLIVPMILVFFLIGCAKQTNLKEFSLELLLVEKQDSGEYQVHSSYALYNYKQKSRIVMEKFNDVDIDGWYIDINLTSKASESFLLEFDIKLYGKLKEENTYKISFLSDGTEVYSYYAEEDSLVEYNYPNPYKEQTETTVYTFQGWDNQFINRVWSDLTINAVYSSQPRKYEVKFILGALSWDNEVTYNLEYGVTPNIPSHNPSYETESNIFTLIGWSPEIVSVTQDVVYTPVFSSVPKEYKISFKKFGYVTVAEYYFPYGQLPFYSGEDLTYSSDSTVYYFDGWETQYNHQPISIVTGETVYYAKFSNSPRSFNVTFKDYDGSIIETQQVNYYDYPKSVDFPDSKGDYFYCDTWDKSSSRIEGDTVITAVYKTVFGYSLSGDNATITSFINKGVTNLVIPSTIDNHNVVGVNYLHSGSFDSITSIAFPEGLINIGSYGFSEFINLESLSFPNSLLSIGNYAFNGCENIETISFSNSLTTIGDYSFSGCSSLESLSLPSNLKTIGNNAFEGCSSLTSLIIPDGVTTINQKAFKDCINLVEVKLSTKLSFLANNILAGCYQIETLQVPLGNTPIGKLFGTESYSDSYAAVQNLTYYAENNVTYYIPNSLTKIVLDGGSELVYGSFLNLSSLHTVEVSNTFTTIEGDTLRGCTSLVNLVLPNLGKYNTLKQLFSPTPVPTSLTNITINGGTLKHKAFEDISQVLNLSINSDIEGGAFYNCPNLNITLLGNKYQIYNHGIYLAASYWRLITTYGDLTDFSFPDSGTYTYEIDSYAFEGNKTIKTFTSPERVSEIKDYTFRESGLESISIGYYRSVYISSYAFSYCKDLSSIIFYNVSGVGNYAFSYCTSLKEFRLPVEAGWGYGILAGCSSLESVEMERFVYEGVTGNNTDRSRLLFGDLFGKSSGDGLVATTQYYRDKLSAEQQIVYYIPETLKRVKVKGYYAFGVPYGYFSNCSNLEIMELGSSSGFGTKTFLNCTGVKELYITYLRYTEIPLVGLTSLETLQLPYYEDALGNAITYPISYLFVNGIVPTTIKTVLVDGKRRPSATGLLTGSTSVVTLIIFEGTGNPSNDSIHLIDGSNTITTLIIPLHAEYPQYRITNCPNATIFSTTSTALGTLVVDWNPDGRPTYISGEWHYDETTGLPVING